MFMSRFPDFLSQLRYAVLAHLQVDQPIQRALARPLRWGAVTPGGERTRIPAEHAPTSANYGELPERGP